ncbi:MAG: HPr family phosphocarrier protein [Fimbriiglobus sp.]
MIGHQELMMPTLGPLRKTVTIANPNGLHMRPASAFAQKAKCFQSQVTVTHGGRRADGKSAVELIMLIAMPGANLDLEIHGDDADQALLELSQILSSAGDENPM